MSLQSDFELCLEYARDFEAKQEQLTQAQNNIMSLRGESERLKSKTKTFGVLFLFLVILLLVSISVIITSGASIGSDMLAVLIIFVALPVILAAVFLFFLIKSKKESDELEADMPRMIQQYTQDAENFERELVSIARDIYCDGLFDIVPKDYFSVAAIEFCLTRIRKKLATTATEAFRQLEAEINRLEQMDYLERMHEERTEQLNNIERAIYINTLVSLSEQNRNDH